MRDFMRILALAVIVAAGMAAPSPVRADSRIFSVGTDQPGVTITQVVRNGRALAVSGTSGTATFFRIDSPNVAIPCSNRLIMTTSTGEQLDLTVDLCASNWELTVQAGLGGSAPGGDQTITIATDDPTASITEVFLDRQSVPIVGQSGNAVQIEVSGDQQGITCDRDLGLALSDGRRIARMVDVCANNWTVVVSLTGNAPSAPPPPSANNPPPPPSNPPPPPPTNQTMIWTFDEGPDSANLVYGIPQTDASELTATCQPGTGRVEISLSRSAGNVRPGGAVFVSISAGAFAKTYPGVGSPVSDLDGASHPEIALTTDDGLWSALIHEHAATVRIASSQPFDISLSGSGDPVKQFVAVCSSSPIVAPPPPPPSPPVPLPGAPPPPSPGGPSCQDEGRIHSIEGVTESTIVFRNLRNAPVQIFWLDYQGHRKLILTVGPRETVPQQTFLTHLWLAADSAGRCIGVYLAPIGQGDAVIR
jgi:VHL beta domain